MRPMTWPGSQSAGPPSPHGWRRRRTPGSPVTSGSTRRVARCHRIEGLSGNVTGDPSTGVPSFLGGRRPRPRRARRRRPPRAGPAITGLQSISTIDGSATSRSPIATTTSASGRIATPGAPRTPRSSAAPRSVVEPRQDLVHGDRGEQDGDVVEHLREDPAEADEHRRAEHRVPPAARDDLDAGRRHRLDEEAADGDPMPLGGGAAAPRPRRGSLPRPRAPGARRRPRSCGRGRARRA